MNAALPQDHDPARIQGRGRAWTWMRQRPKTVFLMAVLFWLVMWISLSWAQLEANAIDLTVANADFDAHARMLYSQETPPAVEMRDLVIARRRCGLGDNVLGVTDLRRYRIEPRARIAIAEQNPPLEPWQWIRDRWCYTWQSHPDATTLRTSEVYVRPMTIHVVAVIICAALTTWIVRRVAA